MLCTLYAMMLGHLVILVQHVLLTYLKGRDCFSGFGEGDMIQHLRAILLPVRQLQFSAEHMVILNLPELLVYLHCLTTHFNWSVEWSIKFNSEMERCCKTLYLPPQRTEVSDYNYYY